MKIERFEDIIAFCIIRRNFKNTFLLNKNFINFDALCSLRRIGDFLSTSTHGLTLSHPVSDRCVIFDFRALVAGETCLDNSDEAQPSPELLCVMQPPKNGVFSLYPADCL